MDDARYVPIWTVANFNQIKRLTNDLKLITEVLKGMFPAFRRTNVVDVANGRVDTLALHQMYNNCICTYEDVACVPLSVRFDGPFGYR